MKNIVQWSVNVLPWRLRRVVRTLPLLAPFQRFLVRRFGSGNEFVHKINAGPARGLRVYIKLPRDKTIWTGTYEAGFAETLQAGVRADDVCYDIGVFRGFMSGVMALAGAKEVFMFEPLPANIAEIERLIALNSSLPLRLFMYAIGDRDGMIELEMMKDPSMSKIHESKFQEKERGDQVMTVTMRSLDSLLDQRQLAPPDVIKVDVEGAELNVLLGAEKTLRSYRPTIFLEAHSPNLSEDCASLLTGLGYRVTVLARETVVGNHGDSAISHLLARHG